MPAVRLSSGQNLCCGACLDSSRLQTYMSLPAQRRLGSTLTRSSGERQAWVPEQQASCSESRHNLPYARRHQRPSWLGEPAGWQVRAAAWLAACLLVCGHCQAAASVSFEGVPRVVDGDTLEVAGRKVRLFGVDAPEKAQLCNDAHGSPYQCGQSAAKLLSSKLQNVPVACTVKDKDQYGREVASCQAKGVGDIGQFMVEGGNAVAYRQYSKQYIPAEESARSSHRGIWQGEFVMPAEWRKQNKGQGQGSSPVMTSHIAGPSKPASSACQIKGNISGGGRRIYHVPGSGSYSATRIDLAKGERYFCTEADARAAGWRPAEL